MFFKCWPYFFHEYYFRNQQSSDEKNIDLHYEQSHKLTDLKEDQRGDILEILPNNPGPINLLISDFLLKTVY